MDTHAETAAAELLARRWLIQIRALLEEATSYAKAADLCAASGNVDGAVKIVMDFEDPAFRAQETFKALLLLKREYTVDPE
ncbi:MAG: hypothetical protein EPO23_12245 [Xanthobacteraceae bacterium]|nr:MAG: hypothetical protein EPO23_12245 [Xanthobacteraceae bacterium]